MKKRRFILTAITVFSCLFLSACTGDSEKADVRTFESGVLTVTFDYQKMSGSASNQFAVWVEDMDGNYVNTLYATKWTANGGYKSRPDSIALWAAKSNLASMQKAEVDALSGATPQAGKLSYSWDLTDAEGNIVTPGEYQFFVEGTLRWKNYVLYSGIITIGDEPATFVAGAEFVYEATERYGALTGESTENAMITAVTAQFTPAGNE